MRALELASQQMLQQQISVVEWSRQWTVSWDYLDRAPLELALLQDTRDCLQLLQRFAESASLVALDRGLGKLSSLVAQWDHWWWVAQREQSPWPVPLPFRDRSPCLVTRQGQRSRVSWSCPKCDWAVSWDLEVGSWETVVWPGTMQCPLC